MFEIAGKKTQEATVIKFEVEERIYRYQYNNVNMYKSYIGVCIMS